MHPRIINMLTIWPQVKIININNIRVNDKTDKNLNNNINKIYLKDNILQNKVYFKKFLNEAFKSYAG